MKLYWNKALRTLGLAPNAQSSIVRLQARRHETFKIELIPINEAGIVELFANGSEGVCVVKTKGEYTGAAKLLDAAWDPPTTAGRGYVFAFLVGGEAIDTAIGTAEKIDLVLELAWDDAGERGVSPPVALEITNNYYRIDEPAPEDPADQLPIPGNVLLKTEQEFLLEEKAQIQANLGIAEMLFRIPLVEEPDFETPGAVGEFFFNTAEGKLWVHTGEQFGFFRIITAP